jgi:cytidylate kinase
VGSGDVPTVDQLTRVVALDGPAGSGKSTVARLAAKALGWRFVDTGATYRAVTLKVLRSGVDPHDPDAVALAAAGAVVDLDVEPAAAGVRLDGEDVTAEIRGPDVTAAVSAVSAVPAVRKQLVQLQRALMGTHGAVVEGRDIATVVAPQAGVKVYLDARPEVRARRRAGDTPAGTSPDAAEPPAVTEVQADLLRRDALDNQTNALEVSDGAIHIDTSDLTLEQVVEQVVLLVHRAGLTAPPGATPSGPGGSAPRVEATR